MESSTNRRWVITGVLGLALMSAGCSAGADPLTQGGPAVVMDAAGQSTKGVAAPPSDKLVGLSTAGDPGKTTSARTPSPASPASAASPATAKKVPAASPRAVNSPDSPESADSP